MRISVFASKELQAVRQATKALPKEVASQLNKATRSEAEPIWKSELARRSATPLQAKVISATATVAVTRSNVTIKAGHRGRALSGGGTPPELIKGAELGGRNTRRFGPRNLKGNVFYPSAAKTIPRLASLWVATAARTIHEAFEGR